jgi:hypothetical protein
MRSSRKRLAKLARMKRRSEIASRVLVASGRLPLAQDHARSAVVPDKSKSWGRSEAASLIGLAGHTCRATPYAQARPGSGYALNVSK